MTFLPVKPTGYQPLDEVKSTELNQLQFQLVDAVDGKGGGTYTLQSDLRLEADSTEKVFAENLESNEMIVLGNAGVYGSVTCGGLSVIGHSAVISLDVLGDIQQTTGNNVSLKNTTVTQLHSSGIIEPTGSGFYRMRKLVPIVATGSASFTLVPGNHYLATKNYLDSGALTYTLSTSVNDGDWMKFTFQTQINNPGILFVDSDSNRIAEIVKWDVSDWPTSPPSTPPTIEFPSNIGAWIEMVFHSGKWYATSWSRNVIVE